MNQYRIQKLIRREQKRQAMRRYRPFFAGKSDWFKAAIDQLFINGPKLRENEQGRDKKFVYKDLRWYLSYLKGKRLGYEIDLD